MSIEARLRKDGDTFIMLDKLNSRDWIHSKSNNGPCAKCEDDKISENRWMKRALFLLLSSSDVLTSFDEDNRENYGF